jgi:hypothetical protein
MNRLRVAFHLNCNLCLVFRLERRDHRFRNWAVDFLLAGAVDASEIFLGQFEVLEVSEVIFVLACVLHHFAGDSSGTLPLWSGTEVKVAAYIWVLTLRVIETGAPLGTHNLHHVRRTTAPRATTRRGARLTT